MPVEDLCIFCGWRIPISVAGYAIKKIMKIAAVIVGLFVAGLAYLTYKGWIDGKWIAMENATRSTLTTIAGQVVHPLNHTASRSGYSLLLEVVMTKMTRTDRDLLILYSRLADNSIRFDFDQNFWCN